MTRDLVAAGGFDALTIDGVARAAKVSRPVVYDLFGDLDGLVTALIDREQQIALAPLMALVGTPSSSWPTSSPGFWLRSAPTGRPGSSC